MGDALVEAAETEGLWSKTPSARALRSPNRLLWTHTTRDPSVQDQHEAAAVWLELATNKDYDAEGDGRDDPWHPVTWGRLRLRCSIDWPLTVALTRFAFAGYNRIWAFLLAIKRGLIHTKH